MKSITSISQKQIIEKHYLIDATGQRIGTLSSKIAELLQGKNDVSMRAYHKPQTKVIVINSGKIDFTAKRGMSKFYKSYSGYPGGLTFRSLEDIMKKDSTKPIQFAVRGMLPKTKRGDEMIANLKIFSGEKHPHEAQKPELIDLKNIKL